MVRILVFGMTENPGGVESFILNYYRHLDRDKIQFDFLCNSHAPVAFEDELLALGGRTFHITARSKNRARYKRELTAVFRAHAKDWDVIWVNVCSLANIDYLKIAKKYGIKKRIIHSHNSQNMDGKLRVLLHYWNRPHVKRYATDFWACSESAAKWFYSGKVLTDAVIIRNAVDVGGFAFDEEKRKNIRDYLGVTDEYVLGNIGRLHFQKNQLFLLDIFKEFLNLHPAAKLVLVGQGEDESALKQKCETLGITEYVYFAGVQKEIDAWLSAFDLFLFPSLFEGLSISAMEAQANGVPVLASSGVIPEGVRINDNYFTLSLEKPATSWAKRVSQILQKNEHLIFERVCENFSASGFEIRTEAKKLQNLLLERL